MLIFRLTLHETRWRFFKNISLWHIIHLELHHTMAWLYWNTGILNHFRNFFNAGRKPTDMPCDGCQCHELIYDAQVINLHEFRIARLYMPGRAEPPGCTSPTESEKGELMKSLEKFVTNKLEGLESAGSRCPDGCKCIYNGRLSEWSGWVEYPDDPVQTVSHTSRDDSNISCEWKVSGVVRVRYRKRLGDCFRERLVS